jgi:hypothetical protein
MNDLLQIVTRARIAERDFAEPAPIERAGVSEDIRAESLNDGGEPLRARRRRITCERVGIDSWHAKPLEFGSDVTLSSCDTTCERDSLHASTESPNHEPPTN